MSHSFFALLSRMKYIHRWALMRNAREENLSEHCLEVGILTHALCLIGNKKLNKKLSVDMAVLRALYHDAAEILTGDMPTPVKYRKEELKTAYKKVEKEAEERLLSTLPDYLEEEYRKVFFPEEEENAALIKCEEELRSGNQEFATAAASTRKKIEEMAEELTELKIFMEDFLPAYGKTLDELTE